MTYENAYHWLQGFLGSHLDALIELMHAEPDPDMRSKLIELIGDARHEKAIGVLARELESPHKIVRNGAYHALYFLDNPEAERIMEKFKQENPHEDFI